MHYITLPRRLILAGEEEPTRIMLRNPNFYVSELVIMWRIYF